MTCKDRIKQLESELEVALRAQLLQHLPHGKDLTISIDADILHLLWEMVTTYKPIPICDLNPPHMVEFFINADLERLAILKQKVREVILRIPISKDAESFNKWLSQQIGRYDKIGYFARKALDDPYTSGYGTLIGYWVTWAANTYLESAAYASLKEYDNEIQNNIHRLS